MFSLYIIALSYAPHPLSQQKMNELFCRITDMGLVNVHTMETEEWIGQGEAKDPTDNSEGFK